MHFFSKGQDNKYFSLAVLSTVWPLSNSDLNCVDPLIKVFLGVVIIVPCDPWWFDTEMWNCGYKKNHVPRLCSRVNYICFLIWTWGNSAAVWNEERLSFAMILSPAVLRSSLLPSRGFPLGCDSPTLPVEICLPFEGNTFHVESDSPPTYGNLLQNSEAGYTFQTARLPCASSMHQLPARRLLLQSSCQKGKVMYIPFLAKLVEVRSIYTQEKQGHSGEHLFRHWSIETTCFPILQPDCPALSSPPVAWDLAMCWVLDVALIASLATAQGQDERGFVIE